MSAYSPAGLHWHYEVPLPSVPRNSPERYYTDPSRLPAAFSHPQWNPSPLWSGPGQNPGSPCCCQGLSGRNSVHSVRKRSVQKPHRSLLPPRFLPFQYPYRRHHSSSAPLLLRIPLPARRLSRPEGCSGKIRSPYTRITEPSGSDIRLLFSAKALFALRASGYPMLLHLSRDYEGS